MKARKTLDLRALRVIYWPVKRPDTYTHTHIVNDTRLQTQSSEKKQRQ